MKTMQLSKWVAVGAAVLVSTTGIRALADQATTTTTAVTLAKNYTGTIGSVDPKEGVLNVRGGAFGSKKFTLGENSTFLTLDKSAAPINDLRAGQKVLVVYQNAHGVLAANRVEQIPMRYEGSVKVIDTAKGTMTLHLRAMSKEFRISEGCKVVLRNNRSGELADVKPGHYVTV